MITGYKVLVEGVGHYGELQLKKKFFGISKGIYFVAAERKMRWEELPNLEGLPDPDESWGQYAIGLKPIADAMDEVFSADNKKLLAGKLHAGEGYLSTFPEGVISITPFGDIKVDGKGFAIDEYDSPVGMAFKETFNIKHLTDVIKVA